MIHIKISGLTITQRKTPKKRRATWIPKSDANPSLFLCQKCRDEMYNEVPSNPKCPTLKMTEKIHDIENHNSFP